MRLIHLLNWLLIWYNSNVKPNELQNQVKGLIVILDNHCNELAEKHTEVQAVRNALVLLLKYPDEETFEQLKKQLYNILGEIPTQNKNIIGF